jgi:hypothetical protein
MTARQYIEQNMDLLDNESISIKNIEIFLYHCPALILPDVLNMLAWAEIKLLNYLPKARKEYYTNLVKKIEWNQDNGY